MRMLGIDSVTDISSDDVVGSIFGASEWLATDPGNGILLAILVVVTDRVVSTGELIAGEGGR